MYYIDRRGESAKVTITELHAFYRFKVMGLFNGCINMV